MSNSNSKELLIQIKTKPFMKYTIAYENTHIYYDYVYVYVYTYIVFQ